MGEVRKVATTLTGEQDSKIPGQYYEDIPEVEPEGTKHSLPTCPGMFLCQDLKCFCTCHFSNAGIQKYVDPDVRLERQHKPKDMEVLVEHGILTETTDELGTTCGHPECAGAEVVASTEDERLPSQEESDFLARYAGKKASPVSALSQDGGTTGVSGRPISGERPRPGGDGGRPSGVRDGERRGTGTDGRAGQPGRLSGRGTERTAGAESTGELLEPWDSGELTEFQREQWTAQL